MCKELWQCVKRRLSRNRQPTHRCIQLAILIGNCFLIPCHWQKSHMKVWGKHLTLIGQKFKPKTFLTSSPSSAPAPLDSLLFFKHSRHVPSSGLPLSRRLSSRISIWLTQYASFRSPFKCCFVSEAFPKYYIKEHPPSSLSSHPAFSSKPFLCLTYNSFFLSLFPSIPSLTIIIFLSSLH